MKVVENGIERDATPEEKARINARIKQSLKDKPANDLAYLRQSRDQLLAETDWWASSDLTMTDAQKKYRQDLRDITKTATSIDDVKWPEKP